MNGKISENFSRAEFRCNCGKCSCDTVDAELLKALEALRSHFKAPITVNSGHRCKDHNRSVGGASNSMHLVGRAADIRIAGVSPSDVYSYLDKFWSGGLGSYSNFTHLDTRNYKARW